MRPASILLQIVGLITAVVSILQWQIWYNDTSQFILGIGISIIFFALSFVYQMIKDVIEEQQALGRAVSEIINKREQERKNEN